MPDSIYTPIHRDQRARSKPVLYLRRGDARIDRLPARYKPVRFAGDPCEPAFRCGDFGSHCDLKSARWEDSPPTGRIRPRPRVKKPRRVKRRGRVLKTSTSR